MTSVSQDHDTSPKRSRSVLVWAIILAALTLGAIVGAIAYGPPERSPVVAAAVIVAAAVTYWVINLWDAQHAAQFERSIAQDENLIKQSRELARRFDASE
jgi:hypothetical protein